MLYQVKSGKKQLSDKALWRLQNAEKEAGIAPHEVKVRVGEPPPKFTPQKTTASAMNERDRSTAKALRKQAAQLEAQAAQLREIADGLEPDESLRMTDAPVEYRTQSQNPKP